MGKQPAFWLLSVALYILFSADPAFADIKQLVMPGPVVEGHARFEKDCERCHVPFKKGSQRQLCLDCHKPLADDLNRKMGYHGRSVAVQAAECKHCHSDHQGRDADILQLDPETFDHKATDFRLEGAHLHLKCAGCHKQEQAEKRIDGSGDPAPQGFYSRAPKDCFSCHRKRDPHDRKLGKNCQDCHQATSWKKVTYRHDKGEFRLKGLHKPVSCVLCHPSQRWKKVAVDCYSCHRLDDSHAGRYGRKCQNCHSEAGPAPEPSKPKSAWKKLVFDHGKTKFALAGKHRKLACDLCHPGQMYGQKLKTDCLSCHRKDDQHRGFYGPKCDQCHTPSSWVKSNFDHQKTTFPLKEKHRKVPCSSCHTRATSAAKLGNACVGCHQLENVHLDSENSRCERCHTPAGWQQSAKFEHDLSRFPLLGLHAVAPCESCHLNAEFRKVGRECLACHKADDKHKGALGRECASCHNPNGWTLWEFDHNAGKKSFKLAGAHRDLACQACHRDPVKEKVKLDRTCAACHRDDDIHRGGFGRNCERCHLDESFKKLRMSS